MPVVSTERYRPDETGGLGYDPQTEELDAYGRPTMRMPRAEGTNNPLSPAFFGLPTMLMGAPAAGMAARAMRVTPEVAPAAQTAAKRPWSRPQVYNQSTGNAADDAATMLNDAARAGNQRAQEVMLGSLRGPQALAQRSRVRSGGPRGQSNARRSQNNE
jgi:hypothetical protein